MVASAKNTGGKQRLKRARAASKAGRGKKSRQASSDSAPATANKKPAGIRLQKLLADRGYGARRKMEGWIKEGRIKVDGTPAELGQRVTRANRVEVDGKPLRERSHDAVSQVSPGKFSAKVLMYHKPEGELVTRSDPAGRPTVFKRLPKLRGARWVAVGRLDINTAGLMLFTTSGELANRLMHPSSGIVREYRCRIYGEPDKKSTRQLTEGIEIDGERMKFEKVVYQGAAEDAKKNRWVHVWLKEGRNREVRRLWEAVDCQVSRLTRVRYGTVQLPRDLRPGKYRNLTPKQVSSLLG